MPTNYRNYQISVKQADNNIFSFVEMFAVSQRNAVLNLIDRIDAYVVAQMVAGKTGYSAGHGRLAAGISRPCSLYKDF